MFGHFRVYVQSLSSSQGDVGLKLSLECGTLCCSSSGTGEKLLPFSPNT